MGLIICVETESIRVIFADAPSAYENINSSDLQFKCDSHSFGHPVNTRMQEKTYWIGRSKTHNQEKN